ncbi:MAG: DUF6155 family protein [Methanosarcinaceae archaeon]|nr:DUF6155 family protein [Methanosarcinaceae archaeon]
MADLLLYYVECGVEFTNDFGDINENFYISIENAYETSLKLIDEERILSKFKNRVFKVVNETRNIGWGFHDCLCEVYYEYYE